MTEMSDFNKAFQYSLGSEGGFVNNPRDHGGATKYGITQATLSRWKKRAVSVREVQDLDLTTVQDIYWEWYWLPMALDQVKSDEIATALFDIGIVRGLTVPIKYAQEIMNKRRPASILAVDGHNGPKTLEAINHANPDGFIPDFADRAVKGFTAIASRDVSQSVFLRGWLARAHRLKTLVVQSEPAVTLS